MINFLSNLLIVSKISCDFPRSWQMGFQDPATPVMEGIINFHHDLFFFMIVIAIFVFWFLFNILYYFYFQKFTKTWRIVQRTHNTVLEVIWTIIPVLILIVVAIPSISLLYAIEESPKASVTLKVIGHQWYWSYEYGDYWYTNEKGKLVGGINYDSYMIPTKDLFPGMLRLLDVDKGAVLPTGLHIRLMITSADVIHSWAIPSLGIKVDACPGRLNMAKTFIKRPGVFYGQCSEICGINHAFMPIVVQAVPVEEYKQWISFKQEGVCVYEQAREKANQIAL